MSATLTIPLWKAVYVLHDSKGSLIDSKFEIEVEGKTRFDAMLNGADEVLNRRPDAAKAVCSLIVRK